ncbi:MAG: DUF5677 domain-containing protein [Steroidobacteraceae bacterium]
MDDDVIPVRELLELLATAVRCAEAASDNLRFDFSNEQHRVCVGLLQAVIEYAKAIHLVARHGMYYACSPLNRSALDALVDIRNACADRAYCENLALRDAQAWDELLREASWGKNPLFAPISESESLPPGRRMFSERIKKLQSQDVEVKEPEARFVLAGMGNEYEAAYRPLSAEAHNNVSFITRHFLDTNTDGLRIRGSRPGNGAPIGAALMMTEYVIDATERVLKLCGHGPAMVTLAPAKDALSGILERLGESAKPIS